MTVKFYDITVRSYSIMYLRNDKQQLISIKDSTRRGTLLVVPEELSIANNHVVLFRGTGCSILSPEIPLFALLNIIHSEVDLCVSVT